MRKDMNFTYRYEAERRKTALTNTGQSALSKKITDSGKEQQIEGQWADIQTWSTEDPNLYVARLELKSPEGR